ncbi:HET domain containing protein [Hyaloscypha variabilis]
MRLINTATGLIEDFFGDDIPQYAILSHTWETDEISFQEFQRLTDPDLAYDPKTIAGKAKAGYVKIQGCVNLASSREIPYVWVDTCCIDKTSSADLTESINSMYRWYANSEVCFAYLLDAKTYEGMDGCHTLRAWDKCRWFTRGWTLQELIAPTVVEFYCNSWHFFGTKQSLFNELSNVTGIQPEVLRFNDLSLTSVARKMSWASQRRTSRKEDMAYCLLGLFDISMPLLYGEGEKAFLRLQEHIAASSTDHTLFAWGVLPGSAVGDQLRSYRSIFARSPADFAQSGIFEERKILHPDTWAQTNRGFHGVFPTIPAPAAKRLFIESEEFPVYIDDENYLIILNCLYSSDSNTTTDRSLRSRYNAAGVWICLTDVRDDGKHGCCRITDTMTLRPIEDVNKLLDSSPDKFRKNLWLATTPRMIRVPRDHFSRRTSGFLVRTEEDSNYNVYIETFGLYGRQAYGSMNILPCRPLPTLASGGLVGMVTVQFVIDRNYPDYKEVAAIIFGYPSNSTKPFAKVVSYKEAEKEGENKGFLPEAALDFAVRKFIEPDEGHKFVGPCAYKGQFFELHLALHTVLHKEFTYTKLDIVIYT